MLDVKARQETKDGRREWRDWRLETGGQRDERSKTKGGQRQNLFIGFPDLDLNSAPLGRNNHSLAPIHYTV